MEPSHRKSWAAVDVCGIASFVAHTLPKEKRLPSHAHDRTGFADALGPARFVVIRLMRRCLAPRPARERTGKLLRPPGGLEEVAVNDDVQLEAVMVQGLASAQSLQRRVIGEGQQSPRLERIARLRIVADGPDRADVEAARDDPIDEGSDVRW